MPSEHVSHGDQHSSVPSSTPLVSDPLPELRPRKQSHLLVSHTLLCGAVAGIAAKTVIAPLERIKMYFQVTSERFTYRAALERGRTLIQREGIGSLWKGHSTTVLRVAPYAALSYTFHDLAEQAFKDAFHTEKLSFTWKFVAGSLGGLGGTLCTYPLDVLRVRMALGASWASAWKQGGLFQGLWPTLLGIVPYSGTAWMAKQTLFEVYHMHDPPHTEVKPPVLVSLAINAIAGLIGQFVTYPLDVLRRRMQVAHAVAATRTLREVLTEMWHKEGPRSLAKGFSLNIFKGPLSLSVSLTVYDILRQTILPDEAVVTPHLHLSSSSSNSSNGNNRNSSENSDSQR